MTSLLPGLPRCDEELQPLLNSEAAIARRPNKGHVALLQLNAHSSYCSQKAAGAASAEHPPRNKRGRGRQGHKKPEDKWAQAGSSSELNPWLPEVQQNTKVICVNQGARQSLQPSLLHPGFASCTVRSYAGLRSGRSSQRVPDCNYQADLKA